MWYYNKNLKLLSKKMMIVMKNEKVIKGCNDYHGQWGSDDVIAAGGGYCICGDINHSV